MCIYIYIYISYMFTHISMYTHTNICMCMHACMRALHAYTACALPPTIAGSVLIVDCMKCG